MKTIARIILFTFNFLFFICGVLQLAFGIVGIASPQTLANFIYWIPGVQSISTVVDLPSVVVSSSVFMIAIGSVMVLFGFLGCAGVMCSHKGLLFCYWILLSILLVVEIILLIFAACNPAMVTVRVQQAMIKSLHKSFQPVSLRGGIIQLPSNVVAIGWVSMQFEVGCCGVNNYTDYQNFEWNNTVTMPDGSQQAVQIPPSCCVMKGEKSVPHEVAAIANLDACLKMQEGFYNTVGCQASVHELLVQYSYIPIGICAAVILIEIVAIAMAVFLWRTKGEAKGV